MTADSRPASFPEEPEFLATLIAAQAETAANKDRIIGWLTGSFAAFNAAAFAVTLSNLDKLYYPRATLAFFAAGLASTFITAVSYALAQHWQLADTTALIDQLEVKAEERDKDQLYADLDKFRSISDYLNLPVGIGTVAVVIAAIGTGVFAVGFHAADPENLRRCAAIQLDMLSAKPRRPDGPDLFQALGCHPQGGGSVYAPARKAEN